MTETTRGFERILSEVWRDWVEWKHASCVGRGLSGPLVLHSVYYGQLDPPRSSYRTSSKQIVVQHHHFPIESVDNAATLGEGGVPSQRYHQRTSMRVLTHYTWNQVVGDKWRFAPFPPKYDWASKVMSWRSLSKNTCTCAPTWLKLQYRGNSAWQALSDSDRAAVRTRRWILMTLTVSKDIVCTMTSILLLPPVLVELSRRLRKFRPYHSTHDEQVYPTFPDVAQIIWSTLGYDVVRFRLLVAVHTLLTFGQEGETDESHGTSVAKNMDNMRYECRRRVPSVLNTKNGADAGPRYLCS
ncbi:uncharacterized protein MYCFIDRAFT_205838 [Pseudocercospora fijiensis CIRAD86]|uniref:Uncharacterized protein n=1 Tax=Pseudocercospora fijiensis (strain CIRAD86) TaxID=383855 RepID=N1QAF1_PSEFD|nr:uncharacterized protein MYCFIDRAFT_205838 [Pseudocercospora fijiensis CIRAD86]EME87907.1 hypothetical protein MYCFIDRAFT_205838 [Pseudocercospora fijiensis CIRAD86]